MNEFNDLEIVQIKSGPLRGQLLFYSGISENGNFANVSFSPMDPTFLVNHDLLIKWEGSRENGIAINPNLEGWFSYLDNPYDNEGEDFSDKSDD